jgi:hypothetical protein
MPRPPLSEIKPEYLELIDLIQECRRQELGKKGHIHIPLEVVGAIAPDFIISMYIEQLGDEGILAPVKETNPPALFVIEHEERAPSFMVLNCRYTFEEISSYKNSLLGVPDGPSVALFMPVNWESVTIRFTTDREVVVTIAPSGEQRVTDFEGLGFVNHKSGRPNLAWVLLRALAQNGGELPDSLNLIPPKVRQQKLALSERLKQIFGLLSDPFYLYREVRTYRIRIALEASTEPEPGSLSELTDD